MSSAGEKTLNLRTERGPLDLARWSWLVNLTGVVPVMWWGEKPLCKRVNGRGRNEVNGYRHQFWLFQP